MDVSELLLEGYGRLPELVVSAVDGLSPDELTWQPGPGTNPIGWLVWHLTRIQDDHVAELIPAEQVWVTGGWAPRFGLAPGTTDTGYGHKPDDVAAVRPESAQVLVDYYDAVAAQTNAFLGTLTAADLDRIVDRRWNPPVTLGVRLVSVLDDDAQHVGQAAYVRGLLRRVHWDRS